MATIKGTEGTDTLQGTVESDDIQALGGDDRIIGSNNNDVIDGGAGNDVLDYSNFRSSVGEISGILLELQESNSPIVFKGKSGQDTISNIETIVGNPNKLNRVSGSKLFSDLAGNPKFEVDLSTERLTYSSTSIGTKTISFKNFTDASGSSGDDLITGDDRDNVLSGDLGNDTIIASKGKDVIINAETIDYRKLDSNVTVSGTWSIFNDKFGPKVSGAFNKIDKSGLGSDSIVANSNKIIGSPDRENTIDVSSPTNLATTNINLATNLFEITEIKTNVPQSIGIKLKYELINFNNVIGTKNNDTIVGSNKNGKLTGGGGNDTITGGTGKDRITGTDSTFKGVGEVDKLTGGGGKDKFILGDSNGAYYLGNGANDYATITDFNLFQDSIDVGSLKDYSFGFDGNGTVDLFAGKDIATRDLVAKIQIAELGLATASKGATSNNMASMSDSATNSIDVISSKIDIVSGVNSTADAIS